jgi:putative N-acetylmannosamine-6-phosphate epimerase
MADISTAAEAQKAAKMGVDAVSTTLAGYVPGALHTEDELYTPNLALVKEIAAMHLPCALVVEGRIWDKEDLAKAFELGADAVVIGKAVTNPMAITKYFLSRVPEDLR